MNCIRLRDAKKFADWMNTQDAAHEIRLPSETEWEYAARSQGQGHEFAGGATSVTCDNFVARGRTCGYSVVPDVCSRSRNLLLVNGVVDASKSGDTEQDLCDMTGSLEEFTADDYTSRVSNLPTNGDPLTLNRSFFSTTRGGSWLSSNPALMSNTKRLKQFFTQSANYIGFRLIRRDVP